MDIAAKTQKENEERVAEEYYSSLSDLNCNSKPLINMLTMLAEENIEYAAVIVKVVADHITKVPPDIKLPILYLIDSIVKNVKNTYVQLFSQCIVSIFCDVFEKVTEKVRERMYALRQTWNEVFSPHKLYTLDVKVKRMDNNWPITAKQPQPSIHVNPNFLKTVSATQAIPTDMEEILHVKTRELLELKKRKLELELEATKKHLEEQEKQLSKATESVIPPIDALVAANASLQPVIRAPGAQPMHLMPALVASNMMVPHHQRQAPTAVGPVAPTGAMRPDMYHHNFRNPRSLQMPHLMAPRMMSMPPQGYPNVGNVGKLKVHPVDPALLNTVRHRDPRLARQLQQQNLQFVQIDRGNGDIDTARNAPRSPENSKNDKKSTSSSSSSSYRSNSTSNKSSRNANGSAPESKSPTRHSSSRSNGRSSKTSVSRADKERDRKRSESKSSTTSSSSAGSNSSSDSRRKGSTIPAQINQEPVETCDKDAFEIVSLSECKQKPSSPRFSPSKTMKESNKRSKESSKSRSNQRNKNNQHSPSSELHASSTKDVDLRILSPSSSASESASPEKRLKLSDSDHVKKDSHTATTSTSKDLDKNIKIMLEPSKDVDLRQLTSSSIESKPRQVPAPDTRSDSARVVDTSSPKVSFKIHKLFNKLEKSTRNLSTVPNASANTATVSASTTSTETQSIASQGESTESGNTEGSNIRQIIQGADTVSISIDSDNENDDAKKRPSTISAEEDNSQPLPKKSKQSSKLDALFGTEDVDLRTSIPPQMLITQKPLTSEDPTPPPPPMISDEETTAETNRENTFNRKASKSKFSNAIKGSQKKLSLLDDVRAKLAKAAKYNKIKKTEKSNSELNQRFKLTELHVSEDTQEANDEKIRTIISQAQELLEANSISPEQYKNLVQTVMSINETNKLEEAKRRESLNAAGAITKLQSGIDEDELEADSSNAEAERREAVLKKRIPKLPKGSSGAGASGGEKFGESSLSENRGSAPGSFYEDKNDPNDDNNAVKLNSNSGKDKRTKPSKWGDRVDPGNAAAMPGAAAGHMSAAQRPWLMSYGNKHHRGLFRPTVPHPPLPPLPNPNLRMPQMPWQMGSTAAPPPFMNSMPLMPQQPPPNVLAAGPAAPPKPCNSIDNPQADLVRTITIDGLAKEIRIYDQVAIVFMELDQPREIGFQAGQRSIIIDNQEPITLQFNDEYRSYAIAGDTHRMRFGFPSRELYIDENWYEIYFGGPPVSIPIRNRIHVLKAEGPPPQVNIGPLRRDLVVGKISMIVDAHTVIPLFLDARVQFFRMGEQEHCVQFADNLLTVLLNNDPIKVEYGGLPKSLMLGDHKYFIRFGALPQGVIAGKVRIKNMAYVKTQQEPVEDAESNTSDAAAPDAEMPTATADVATELKLETDLSQTADPQATNVPNAASNLTLPMAVLNNINIDELFQKLVSKGILPGATKKVASDEISPAAPEEDTPVIAINPVDLNKPDTIKMRQAAIVATLFSGMQCSSCGVRFPPEQTIKYSQHLDWHFRQNRRERDSTRKAHSRRWYYDLGDWVQYEEIEDLEEREKNFFESQQNELEANDEASNQRSAHSPAPSCAAGPDDVDRICDMCNERFEQFYNEDLEEWHLRSAIRIEDKIYHPICYEDYKASLKPPVVAEDEQEKDANVGILDGSDDNAMDTVIKVEGDKSNDEITVADDGDDDDDDDVIMLPNEEPSVTEIDDDDDEEYQPFNVTREEMGVISVDIAKDEEGLNDAAGSDVEIQEPNIPFTDLDTYVETQLPKDDDASRLSFTNIKIKEEPKDDEDDEDDDFEDVGTVLIIPEEEISVQSSNAEILIQAIDSSTSAVSPATAEPEAATSESPISIDAAESTEPPGTELNITSMDEDLETDGKHNLSTVGPAPAIPLASLVNKIKINITKNVASTTTATTNTTSSTHASSSIPPPTVSTIPVLCGGTASSSTKFPTIVYTDGKGTDSAALLGAAVSTISVIGGSYGRTLSPSGFQQQQVPPPKQARQPTPPPVPVEDTITYEQKASLQKISLQKVKKVECGVETSGLCSIM